MGTEWHAHTHYLFDPETGARPAASLGERPRPDGYTKRLSLFYDVVHLNRADLGASLGTVRELHAGFLADAGIPAPERLAFRAGGWDYGSTADELGRYVEALAAAGFAFDSSAVVGAGWSVGSRFGAYAFALAPGLAEVAPVASADCGAGLASRRTAAALRDLLRQSRLWLPPPRPGVLVTVLHFGYLFSVGRGRPEELVRSHLRLLSALGRALRLNSGGFGDLRLHASRRTHSRPMS